LNEWQSKVNLVSHNTLKDVWIRHIADSLSFLPLIPDKSLRIADIGSGAGFPGMVLAIAGCSDVHLFESDRKKCIFLKEAARVTDTRITVHNQRAEDVTVDKIALATSRACGSLSELLNIVYGWGQENVVCLFSKGQTYGKEIHEAGHWKFEYEVIPSQVDASGVILKIWNIGKGS